MHFENKREDHFCGGLQGFAARIQSNNYECLICMEKQLYIDFFQYSLNDS